jgi:hypothetical protein
VVDEAHHSVANTYKAVLRGLGFVDEVAVASSSSSMSEAGDAAGQGEVIGVDAVTAEIGQLLSERRREWKKQYIESGAEPDDAVVGLQALPYADGFDYSDSSTDTESTEDSDAAAAAAAAGLNRRGSSSGSGGGAESEQLAMRALSNPDKLCVGFTATPYR